MKDYGLRELFEVFAASQNTNDYPEMREYNERFYISLSFLLGVKIDIPETDPVHRRRAA